MTTLATAFIVIAAIAIVIQAGILIALYAAFKKTSTRVDSLTVRLESLTNDFQNRFLPTIDAAQSLFVSSRPKLEIIIDNLSATSTTVRSQVERLDSTVNDVVDRARLQIIRADELVTRTMDRVEETTETVQRTVVSPLRLASGLLQGLSAGFGTFFGRMQQPGNNGHQREEMFI